MLGIPAWILFALMANVFIITTEYLNRHYSPDGGWLAVLPVTIVPIVLAQFGLFKCWSGAPHLLAAWLVFTIGNSAMRLGMVRWTTEEGFAWWGVLGVALMICGALVVKESLRYGTSG